MRVQMKSIFCKVFFLHLKTPEASFGFCPDNSLNIIWEKNKSMKEGKNTVLID